MRIGPRVVVTAVGVLLMNFTAGFAASCPRDAHNGRDCADPSSLAHVYNEHCTGKAGKSEFVEHYCKDLRNLQALCVHASHDSVKIDALNCYATGEEGEIVGYTWDKKPTDCYKVVFTDSGFGKVALKSMYPVQEAACK
jgi:hypothetical protein